jgi:hypothetical protein
VTERACSRKLVIWLSRPGEGYPDRALEWRNKAIDRAVYLNHPYTLAMARGLGLLFDSFSEQSVDEGDIKQQLALCADFGVAHPQAFGTIFQALGRDYGRV